MVWRDTYDVIIIGGGVVGCMTARFLSRYDLRVLLIEQGEDIGAEEKPKLDELMERGRRNGV